MKLLILILALFPLTVFANGMKIFSMNLHCGLDNWKARMDMVVSEILKSHPDVIGLQEVCYNTDMNMASYIRAELMKGGYPVVSFETFDTHTSFVKYQEQLLLISRHKMAEKDSGVLPGPSILKNGFVSIRIGDQWFLTTHLHFALGIIRKAQYDFIQKKFGERNAIIFGDLNSNPEDSETEVLKNSGWTSVFDGATYPSNDPKKTFDGFWMTETFYSGVLATTIERQFLNSRIQPSDHLGIELTLLSR